jgi:heme-degrading monooxygenase HmoA
MPTVSKANNLLAEFAIFPVTPDRQADLVASIIQQIESQLPQKQGFVSATVIRSRDGERVTSYIQWTKPEFYLATTPLADYSIPDTHLFEIFAEEPEASILNLSLGRTGLLNFGIFKLKKPENQPRFLELFRQALVMVSGQKGLISTHAHRSLDGWRCINFGHWQSLEAFTAMDSDRPFSPLFGEMLDLATNEYQKTLHELVFALDRE